MSQNFDYNKTSAFQPYVILTDDEIELIEDMRENNTCESVARAFIAGMVTNRPAIAPYKANIEQRVFIGTWGQDTSEADTEAEELLGRGSLKRHVEEMEDF
jgi:hypothetical protein